MRLFGSLSELNTVVFRQNGFAVTVEPNISTTYTAARSFDLPPGDSSQILVSATSTQTLTNKSMSGAANTFTAIPAGTALSGQVPTVNGGTGVNSTATFPTSGVVVTEAATETLTNKTLGVTNTVTTLDTLFTIQDDVDNTKQAKFQASGISTATTRTFTFPDISDTLVTLIATQTLTNKTLTGAVITDFEEFIQVATPATPAAGRNRLYYKTDGKLYTLNSAGVESVVGSGSGSGQKNYVANPNDAAANWAVSGAGATVATSTSASRPDNITQSTAIAVTRVSGTTDYARTRFTLDAADYNKKLQILWDQSYAGAAGDYLLQVYSNTAANYAGTSTQLTTPVTSLPAGTLSFNTTFDSPGSTAPYIEIRVVVAAGTTPLYLNNVTVTPGQVVQGAAVSDWVSWTPTGTWTSNATYTGLYRRVGSVMDIQVNVALTGTPTSASLSVNMPTGFTIDVARVIETGTGAPLGQVISQGTSQIFDGLILYNSPTSVQIKTSVANGIYTYLDPLTQAAPVTFASGNRVIMRYSVPIAEWAGNAVVNLGSGAAVEYASNSSTSVSATDTTSFSTGLNQIQSITAQLSRRVRFQYPIQANDLLTVQISGDGLVWSDVEGSQVYPKGSSVAVSVLQNQTSINYGIGRPNPITGTTSDVDVLFGQYAGVGVTTYGAAGQAWGAGGNLLYWRVRKSTASAPVGFGLAGTDGSSGLYKPGAAPGVATNTAASAGSVGEYISATQPTATNFPTTAQYGDAVSISLTAGDWDVSFIVDLIANGSTTTSLSAGISTTSGNSSTGLVSGDTMLQALVPTAATNSNIVIPVVRALLASTTTYYGKINASYSVGNPQYRCRLSARRVR